MEEEKAPAEVFCSSLALCRRQSLTEQTEAPEVPPEPLMIALQTVMACQYWLFSYYKLLLLVPFCHDLLGKHRKQVSAAEVCGYELFGGGWGEAQLQLAVSSCSKKVAAAKKV